MKLKKVFSLLKKPMSYTWDPNAAFQRRITFAAPEGRVAAPPAAQLQGRPVVRREVHDGVLLQPCTNKQGFHGQP
jgi:hypothetical protein